MDGFRRHIHKAVAHRFYDITRDLELPAGLRTHARGASDVARVVERHDHIVVGRLIDVQSTFLHLPPSELEDMLRHRVLRIEEVERTCKGVQETVSNAPCVATFTEDDALDAQFEGGLADAHRDPAHVLV